MKKPAPRASVSSPREWAEPVSSERVVVVAASAGGIEALSRLLSTMPADFPAAIVVVQHRRDDGADLLPQILASRTALDVCSAQDGDILRPGTVYVCPPGKHIVAEHSVRIVDGPPLDHVRPSANAMLASVAHTYGDRAIGVVLSGTGSDGTTGCLAVAKAGGVVVAQEPSSAAFPGMPAATAERGAAEHVVALDGIAGLLNELVAGTPRRPTPRERPALRTKAIRVILADDHRIILDGLRTLLSTEADIEVVGEAEDGTQAVEVARALTPDVVVIDIAMPSLDGIEAARLIRAERADTQVVVLSAYVDDKRAIRILEAGATACLSKDAAYAELATAIREAAMGHRYFSARMAAVFTRASATLESR